MSSVTHHVEDTESARAVVRPPLLFVGCLLVGFALDHVVRLPFPIERTGMAHWISALIAICLLLAGVAAFAGGVRNFASAGTPVPGTQPTRTLVTGGIHGWSRNPIYVGMFLIYGGIGLTVRSLWILILMLVLALIMRYGVVAREEAYLERRFGDAYRDYKERVRRWL